MKMIRVLAAAGLLATGVGASTAASAQYNGVGDYYGGQAYYSGGYARGGYDRGYDHGAYRRSGYDRGYAYGYDRPRWHDGRGYGHYRDRYGYRGGWDRHDGWRGW